MPEFTTLELDLATPVTRLTLARPERLNALSPEVLTELAAASDRISASSDVKVVVVSGAGRAFCAGYDLDAVQGTPSAEGVDLGRRMAGAVAGIPALTIAAIHGHCVGGGLVLA